MIVSSFCLKKILMEKLMVVVVLVLPFLAVNIGIKVSLKTVM